MMFIGFWVSLTNASIGVPFTVTVGGVRAAVSSFLFCIRISPRECQTKLLTIYKGPTIYRSDFLDFTVYYR